MIESEMWMKNDEIYKMKKYKKITRIKNVKITYQSITTNIYGIHKTNGNIP